LVRRVAGTLTAAHIATATDRPWAFGNALRLAGVVGVAVVSFRNVLDPIGPPPTE
jgi:hypothetical protein